MTNKLLVFSLVVGTVFLISFSGTSICINEFLDDVLDQYQLVQNPENASIGGLDNGIAQSFKPTLNRLTRVELFAEKIGNPTGSIWVSIRLSLEGDDLGYRILDVEEITKTGGWYEIDFNDDIIVEPEQTYYIIWSPDYTQGDDENIAFWGCNWYDNFYTRGEMWNEYPAGNWFIDNHSWDCCFKTYGIETENYPPEPPIINGPKMGRPGRYYGYTFLTIDPNEDDVQYQIDWGDGDIYDWGIVCESNDFFSRSHKWTDWGNFTIKARAKDIYGAVGGWSSYVVTMPRDKTLASSPLLRLLERYPLLNLLFQRIIIL